VLLDITATREGSRTLILGDRGSRQRVLHAAAYGGGIRTVEEARRILKLGVEKIVLNTIAWRDVAVLTAASEEFGAQAIVASSTSGAECLASMRSWSSRPRKELESTLSLTLADSRPPARGDSPHLGRPRRDDARLRRRSDRTRERCGAGSRYRVGRSGIAARLSDRHPRRRRRGGRGRRNVRLPRPHRAVLITYPGRTELEAALP
jgi:cyclase